MSASPPDPFAPKTEWGVTIAQVMADEIQELGAFAVFAGLTALLDGEAGQIVSEGVTPQMHDGTAAMVLAGAEAVAMALGQPRGSVDSLVAEAVAPLAAELQAERGLADLALRALDVIGDPTHPNFGASPAAFDDRAAVDAAIADIRPRLIAAKAAFPGDWQLTPAGPSPVKITIHSPDHSPEPGDV